MYKVDSPQAQKKLDELWDSMQGWIHLVKRFCVKCGKKLKKPVENYFQRGNFCQLCDGKYSRKSRRDELIKGHGGT